MKLGNFARAVTVVLTATGVATPAFGQAVIPFPPIDGLIARPDGWQPVPRPRPSPRVVFSGTCEPVDPGLHWARLPHSERHRSWQEMIGQLLMVNYGGSRLDSKGVQQTRRAIAASEISGVLAFRNNIASADDIRAINTAFLGASEALPPLLAVDQEGGKVVRVRASEGAPRSPSAADVAKEPLSRAADTYQGMAEHLASLGFTVNFGPVVDLAVDPSNPVITRFGRSYGRDPQKVTQYAQTFIDAHREAGILTSAKHFPGHGSSRTDSHDTVTDVSATWTMRELAPFRDLARSGVPMIMAGHIVADAITEDATPASLSKSALTGFLRDTICYDGIIVSDDIAMRAVKKQYSLTEAAEKAIDAGVDLVLMSAPPSEIMPVVGALTDKLALRAQNDPQFAERIRQSYARIVHAKLDIAADRAAIRPTGDVFAWQSAGISQPWVAAVQRESAVAYAAR